MYDFPIVMSTLFVCWAIVCIVRCSLYRPQCCIVRSVFYPSSLFNLHFTLKTEQTTVDIILWQQLTVHFYTIYTYPSTLYTEQGKIYTECCTETFEEEKNVFVS